VCICVTCFNKSEIADKQIGRNR